MGVPSTELAQRASRGDEAALGDLMGRHLSALRAYVRLRAGHAVRAKESVSDLVQSACREVLCDLGPDAKLGEAEFRQWLYRAALHKVIDRARFHKAERRDVAREVNVDRGSGGDGWAGMYASVVSPSQAIMSKEEVHRIEATFDELDEAQREVILLARVAKLPHVEIAKTMGRTEQATRSLLSRALARLAGLLDQDPEE